MADPPKPQARGPVHKTLASAANLANLLPTGTLLAFQALTPSFSNSGSCNSHVTHKYLTASLVFFFAMACFLSSFTDSLVGPNGKLYYGVATPKGLYIFNLGEMSLEENEEIRKDYLAKYRIKFIDFVHAFVSLVVFFVFVFGDSHVVKCFFGDSIVDWNSLIVNLPLAAGALSSFLFMIFPTTRRGIGYGDHKGS